MLEIVSSPEKRQAMKVFNNITDILRDDMTSTIKKGSKVSIAAACFSMYAYNELKKQLENIDEFRFIFTYPTFIAEKAEKQKREFYIPRLNREHSLYGTEFELKLRNEMTQKAVARECAEWIRKKATFKSNTTGNNMGGFATVESVQENVAYMPLNGFTTVDIGCERGNNSYNMVNRMETPFSEQYMQLFETIWNDKTQLQDVTDVVIENISTVYNENSPELIYFMTLYNVFSEFLEDISEDVLPNEATGFKSSKIWDLLYDFQKDAVLAIINKLEKYNGCILADSVGLGKTFTALAVIKYYENRNKTVLVLCPKKLAENWNTYKDNYINNPIASDRLNYDVLFHTDLSREYGNSNGLDLDRLNWGNYDLVVIDESHNFRNGGAISGDDSRENRYLKLLNRVIRAGVKTKVLMLSATPVNNRFNDLKNQLAIAYEGDSKLINNALDTTKTIDVIFRQAQKAFNVWSKLEPESRTTEALLRTLDFDFFEVLDSVTIARSRKHIIKYYNTEKIGKFPERLKPISLCPNLTDMDSAINYNDIYEQLSSLSLRIYTPSDYIFPSKVGKYIDLAHNKGVGLTQQGREEGIRRLMSINLLKRLESSVYSFKLTLGRILELIVSTIRAIDQFEKFGSADIDMYEINKSNDFDMEDQNTDFFSVGKKVRIELCDMDYISWRDELKKDADILELLTLMIADITPEHDKKLQTLLKLLSEKIEQPINADNKKVLIFSAFSDTAEYLYEQVGKYIKNKYGLETAMVTGDVEGKTTIKGFRATLNNVLTCFSPISKGKDVLMPDSKEEIDILIATDCISEGQNLQDCDYLVNYDIHWNPVRIIQRFGRIDRIGSRNAHIQLVNFWPDLTLDEYINLKNRVETRMKISVMTSTGDDDLINAEEKGDLQYRKHQLQRLQEEVVDIEDMSSGISIMDLGLNEFRLDLLEYIKTHKDLDKKPFGLHAVVPASEDMPQGAIFILKNTNNRINIDNQNRIHPFYMVYIGADGEIICDYLKPKKLLDTIRLLCRGKDEAITELCRRFNAETDDGRDMSAMSELLNEAIDSIIDIKEENDIDSLFKDGGTYALLSEVSGIEDFELICFIVVK
jgi:SNF2 family DNA or RNA helicase